MPRRYEIVYIFDSTMEEAKVNESLERFHKLITDKENPEPITGTSHWGKRSLAYLINGREIGYYVVEQFSTDPTLLGEFERALKLDEEVLRYQIVLNEGEGPRPPRERSDDDDDDDDDPPRRGRKSEDDRPRDRKADDRKPEDKKPEESKPEDTKPEESKPEDTKTEESKPEDTKTEDSKEVTTNEATS